MMGRFVVAIIHSSQDTNSEIGDLSFEININKFCAVARKINNNYYSFIPFIRGITIVAY